MITIEPEIVIVKRWKGRTRVERVEKVYTHARKKEKLKNRM